MNLPDFDNLLPAPILNHLTGEAYLLQRVDRFLFTNQHHMQITDICNEPRVYDLLFRERRRGIAYKLQDARGFIQWGVDGWRTQNYFLFFVTNEANEIAAAVDIKGSNLVSSEIGYWCSEHHRGIMTNAVATLTTVMTKAGYTKAHALVLPTNDLSSNVLLRNNFELLGTFDRDLVTYNKYNKVLATL